MEVTKLKTTRPYTFSRRVYEKGTKFYVSNIYRKVNSTADISDVFYQGDHIASIRGHWFDYANKTLFVRWEDE